MNQWIPWLLAIWYTLLNAKPGPNHSQIGRTLMRRIFGSAVFMAVLSEPSLKSWVLLRYVVFSVWFILYRVDFKLSAFCLICNLSLETFLESLQQTNVKQQKSPIFSVKFLHFRKKGQWISHVCWNVAKNFYPVKHSNIFKNSQFGLAYKYLHQ